MEYLIVFLSCIAIGLIIFLGPTIKLEKRKPLARFYQIWLKDEFLSSNFFVMGGYEKRNKLISHNGIIFSNKHYKYAILPFINVVSTDKQLLDMSEKDYLQLCLKLTQSISIDSQESDE